MTIALADRRSRSLAHRPRSPVVCLAEHRLLLANRDQRCWKPGPPVTPFDGTGPHNWPAPRALREASWFQPDQVPIVHEGAAPLVTRKRARALFYKPNIAFVPGCDAGPGYMGSTTSNSSTISLKQPLTIAVPRSTVAFVRLCTPAAGPWQALTSRVMGRIRPIDLDGVTTSDRTVLEGFAATTTDRDEDEPGPITLQRDQGIVEFRNMMLTPVLP